MESAIILYWNGLAQWGTPDAISLFALQAFENGDGFCMATTMDYNEARQFMLQYVRENGAIMSYRPS